MSLTLFALWSAATLSDTPALPAQHTHPFWYLGHSGGQVSQPCTLCYVNQFNRTCPVKHLNHPFKLCPSASKGIIQTNSWLFIRAWWEELIRPKAAHYQEPEDFFLFHGSLLTQTTSDQPLTSMEHCHPLPQCMCSHKENKACSASQNIEKIL